MPKSKKNFKPAPTTKKPAPFTQAQKISLLQTIIIQFLKKNSSENLNGDLEVLMTAVYKVLYGIGMAVNERKEKEARELVIQILDKTTDTVKADMEEAEKKAAEKAKAEAEPKKKTAKPKVQKLNSKKTEA